MIFFIVVSGKRATSTHDGKWYYRSIVRLPNVKKLKDCECVLWDSVILKASTKPTTRKHSPKVELPVLSLNKRSAVTNYYYSDSDFLREWTGRTSLWLQTEDCRQYTSTTNNVVFYYSPSDRLQTRLFLFKSCIIKCRLSMYTSNT